MVKGLALFFFSLRFFSFLIFWAYGGSEGKTVAIFRIYIFFWSTMIFFKLRFFLKFISNSSLRAPLTLNPTSRHLQSWTPHHFSKLNLSPFFQKRYYTWSWRFLKPQGSLDLIPLIWPLAPHSLPPYWNWNCPIIEWISKLLLYISNAHASVYSDVMVWVVLWLKLIRCKKAGTNSLHELSTNLKTFR